MKKILLSIFSIFTLLTGVVFVGCGEKQSASAIVLESDSFTDETNHLIEFDLTQGANVSVVVKATIEGQDNGQVYVDNNYENIIHCEVSYNQNINTNTITITALEESDKTVEIIVKARSGNVVDQKILVNTYSHITAINQKKDSDTSKKTQYIPLDEEITLTAERYLDITARDTCNKKDIVWGYVDDNNYGNALVIVGNKIRLDSAKLEEYESSIGAKVNSITIKAQSKYQEGVSTYVTLEVIKSIEFNAKTDFTQSYNSANGFSSVYDADGNMQSYELVRTTTTDEHSVLYYKISLVSEREVTWVELTDKVLFEEFGIPEGTLDITKSYNYDDATKTYTFIFEVKNEKSAGPANYSFNFSFTYKDYDYTLKTDKTFVSLVDVVERIEVTSENNENFKDGDTIDLYNNYANKKGLFFDTNLYPSTAKDTKYFIRVIVEETFTEAGKTDFNINDYFHIYTEADGLISFEREQIDGASDYYFKSTQPFGNATKLYAKAIKTNVAENPFSLSFVSNANANIKTTLKLNFVYAPDEDFDLKEDDDNTLNYSIETSEITTTVIKGKCEALAGRKDKDLVLDYVKSDDYSISDFVFNQTGDFSFNVSTNKKNLNSKFEVWLCHKNGFKATKPITIEFFKALTSASVSLLNSNSNNIADYSIKSQSYGGGVDNSLDSVVATFGSTLSLQFDHNAHDCLKEITLHYFVVGEKNVEGISSFFDNNNIDTSKEVYAYFSYNAKLSSLTLLTTKTTFTAFVVVEFSGYDASHNEIKLYRIFKVDSYVPVSTLATKSTPVEMIASDSLSAQDAETLSKKTIEVSFRTDSERISYYSFDSTKNEPYFSLYSATAKNDKTGAYVWNEDDRTLTYNGEIIYSITNVESLNGRKLSFVVNTESTKDFNEFNDIIVLEYKAFKSVYRLSIDLTIKNSDRVESVIWENETDDGELYILTRKIGDVITENNKATIITTVQNAYNTKLNYKYIPINGAQNVISFNENGKNVDVVANEGYSGGYGYVYVLPQDAVKKNEQVIFSYYDEDLNIKTNKIELGKLNDSCLIEGNESINWFEFLTQKAFFVTNDGRVVSYSKILLRIKLTVADGLSEETAIRIYTSDEIQNMTSENHYVLMNSVELSGHSSLSNFKGSLRGYNSDIVITMKDDSSSLFGNISESGIVRDLTFNGSVNNAFVAGTNSGTISNVTIDVSTDSNGMYIPSNVTGSGFVGGIAQINTQNGGILSSKVLGVNISGNSVGGVVGKNSGTIDGCVVEFYNFKDSDDDKYANKFEATGENSVAGGIVGTVEQTSSVIKNSYVYDYTLSTENTTQNILANTLGAIVGACIEDAKNSTISNSFAVVNIENFVGSGEFTITDCYTGYYIENAGNEYASNITKINAGNEYASNITKINAELWINDGDENFNANINGGFSHLKFAQSEKVDTSTIEFNDSNSRFIKVNETTAILYLYEVNTAKTLNNAEKTSLKNKNTYNLSELFNIEDEATSYVVVSSQNSNLAKTQLGKIELTNVGETQITLLSKQDFSTEKTFTIKVIHIIDDFKANYNGLETTGIEVQEGRSAQIDFTIKQKTYLNSAEEFDLVLDNIQIKADELTEEEKSYFSYSIENNIGSINVKSGAKENNGACTIINYIEIEGLAEEYNDAIKNVFKKEITIIPFEGTNYIRSDYSAISLYPSLSSTFEITLGTDSQTDDLLISIIKENTKLQVWKEDGGELEQISSRTINVGEGGTYVFAFGDTTKRIQLKISRKTYDEINKEYVYQFVISVCDEYKSSISTSEDYTLSLSSKNDKESEFSKDIKLTLESQKIENIEMTNYTILQVVNQNGTIKYTRSNNSVTLVAPGSSSILEVNIDPTYSYYEYLTISYVPQNNQLLTFTALNKQGAFYTQNLSSNVSSTTYGLMWAGEKLSSFAFKVYVSANIKTDCVFPITVSFYGYDKDNNIICLESREILLYVTCVAQPTILVNGSEYTMMAKGSSADVEVTLESDQNIESLTYEGDVKGIALSTVAIVDNQDGTKTYKYRLTSKVTSSVNGGLGQFGLKATVSRVLNGIRETTSMTAYIALVEIEVSSVSIVNAEYNEEEQLDIVTAYENIIKSFEFNYEFNPSSYGNNLTTEENQAVIELNCKRELLKSQGYLGNDDNYHINYTYDETTKTWKEILFKDQLYIVGSNGREQKITWTALDENTYSYTHYEGSYAKFKLTFDKKTNAFTITGSSTTSGIVKMRIKTVQYITSQGKDIYWESSYDFAVQVKSYTSEDSPEDINNAKEFLDIQSQGEAKPYILMNDIVLENYVPFDTSLIKSLDGNGYTIYLNSFDMSAQETNLQLALFTNVNANTTLKNVRVNIYNGGQISVDTNNFTNVEIAGLAISNDGIIYNCEVVSFYNEENNKKLSVTENGIVVTYKRGSTEIAIDGNYNITSRVAGFVLENSGNITNSRVGGTELYVINETAVEKAYYKTIELGKFTIKAQGEVSGFVSSNTKNIISSKASNMQITNESNYNKFETAGFVNTNSGIIKSSYITGIEDGKNSFAFLSSSIESKGIIAGFVINNTKNSKISDCMTNIKISTSSLFGAGFVYKNEGEIIYAFSASQVESSSFTQMGFTGLDAEGNLLSDEGKISFSYYYDLDYASEDDVETTLDTGATLLMLQDSNNEKLYYGFSFASGSDEEERRENADGIWYFREDGKISIVSADTIAHSVRYKAGQAKDNSFIYAYSDMINNDSSNIENGKRFTTEYGSKYNPIIIATADDFDEAMGKSKSTNISKYYNSTEVFGSYRFVNDIDFDELSKNLEGGANVSSTSKSLVANDKGVGIIDGNGFAIKNLSITSNDNSENNGVHSFGLFSKVLNGAKILNLTLEVINVTADDVYVVGSLAGLVYNSTIVGIHVDQKYSITPDTSTESSEDGVKGNNIAGSVVGAVVGTSKIKDVSVEDASVQVSFYEPTRVYGKTNADYYLNTFDSRKIRTNLLTDVSNLSVFGDLSIAGGVVGYIDTFNENEKYITKYEHKEDTSRTYRVVNISATSTVNVRGEVVGGLFGYTSETTNTENANLVLYVSNSGEDESSEENTYVSKILSYNGYAGGITGLASGYYFRIYTTHDETTQNNIESGYNEYYNGTAEETAANRGILDLFYTIYDGQINFDYNTQVIGGLVGTFVTGEIENSYSKINVLAKPGSVTTAGGVAGRVAYTGERFTYTLEIADGASVATSLLLKEVYVTGDVRGGFTSDSNGTVVGYGGGLVGQVDRQASLSLLAVNAVNAFGYKDITTSTKEGASEATGDMSSVGVYAFVGGKEATRGTINILAAPSYNSNGEKDATVNAATKSVGYFDYILNNSKEKIEIKIYEGTGLRVNSISTSGANNESGTLRVFKIESVSEFTDVEDGFNSVLSAFTVGKHWNPNNWKSVRTKIYPEIRFSAIKTFLYLDNINKTEVANKMRYSNVIVYVRGLKDDGTYDDVDMTTIGTIEGFSGQIIGPDGWLTVEEKEKGNIARKSFKGDYVGIIINKNLFNNAGQGFSSKDLRVEVGDPNSSDSINASGSIYVSGSANSITISNMTFNINVNCRISPISGCVGVVCSSVSNSSITDTTINIAQNGKITVEGSSEELNIGLFAGFVEVGNGNKYEYNNVVTNGTNNSNSVLDIKTTGSSCEKLNIGGLFGRVDKTSDSGDISIQISGLDISRLISVNGDLSETTANIGGQVGLMQNIANVTDVAVTVNNDNFVEINSDGKIKLLNYGGIVGSLEGVVKFETSGAGDTKQLAKTKLKYKTVTGDSKIYAGGLFGTLSGSSSDVTLGTEATAKVDAVFEVGNESGCGLTTGAIGGIVGKVDLLNSLSIKKIKMKFNASQYNNSSSEINTDNSMENIQAHIGGIVGQNSTTLAINNVDISGTINAASGDEGYVGGLVGLTTGNVYINVKQKEGVSGTKTITYSTEESYENSEVSINIISDSTYVGGAIGYIDKGTNICICIKQTLYSGTIQVFGGNSHSIGGIVGFVSYNSGLNITNSGFGGNIIAQGDGSQFEGGTRSQTITCENLAKLTIGGIVGDMNYTDGETRTNQATISNCTSYGDAIIRYGDTFKTITNYNFGGIVGEANNVSISSCNAFMMNNNGRMLEKNYYVGALVGAKNSLIIASSNYSSALCLCVENDENCTDIAYKTAFSDERKGYNDSESETTAIETIKRALAEITVKDVLSDSAQGSKLNPYTTGNEIKRQSPIVYVVMDTEANLNNYNLDIKSSATTPVDYKYTTAIAFIGDGFTVGIDDKEDAIFNNMGENDVVSSVVINANIDYDVSETDEIINRGTVAHKMTGGTIFATGVYGSMSIGGTKALTLGGLVGNITNGLITESYTSVDMIYRAAKDGKISGFANAESDGYVSILNSFSTGKVETYIDVPAYAFSYIDGANVKVDTCYTISPVDINNHTSEADPSNTPKVFGGTKGKYTNCYNDQNAVNDINTNGTNLGTDDIYATNSNSSPTQKLKSNTQLNSGDWKTLKHDNDQIYLYNYGYPMRDFGFLKRKTFVEAEQYVLSKDTEKDSNKTYYAFSNGEYVIASEFVSGELYEYEKAIYQLVPNATKLAQISSSNYLNYILEYDIDLSTTSSYSGVSENAFINIDFSGKLKGNGKTINGLKYQGLFKSLSGATIENLRLTNVAISSSENKNVGAISSSENKNVGAIAKESTDTNLLNKISVNGEITSSIDDYTIGGLVGTSSGNLTITDSQNYIRLVGNKDGVIIGGFVGNSSGTLSLKDCVNYGTIETKKSGTIGGLVGISGIYLTVSNCGNTNSVICGYTETGETKKIYIAGGIVGEIKDIDQNNKPTINYTYNSAMVKAGHKKNTAGTNYSAAGGIIGLQNNEPVISNCLNQGPIEALGSTAHMTTSFAVEGSEDDSKITFTYSGTINVYADAFANTTISEKCMLATNSKNEASVFRNGCFTSTQTLTRTGFKFDVNGGEIGGFGYYNKENLKYIINTETYKPTQQTVAGWRIGSSTEVTGVYVTQTDDLGAPTTFFITIPRTIYYPNDTYNTLDKYYDEIFTRKQEIYAKDEVEYTYYDLAHKDRVVKNSRTESSVSAIYGNGSSEYNTYYSSTSDFKDIEALDTKSATSTVTVTIAGKEYAVADTGEKLFKALNANIFTTNPVEIKGTETITFSYGNGNIISKTISDMITKEDYDFEITNVSWDANIYPNILSAYGYVTKNSDNLSIEFKYTCSSETEYNNAIFTYDLVAKNPNKQKLEVKVSASSLGYEKIDSYWRTVIYLDNLTNKKATGKESLIIDNKTYTVDAKIGTSTSDSSLKLTEELNIEIATITKVNTDSKTMEFTITIDGTYYTGTYNSEETTLYTNQTEYEKPSNTDANGNTITIYYTYPEYFQENMTDGTTYKVKIGGTTYDMLYDKNNNMFIYYDYNEKFLDNSGENWNGKTISWDINQNKTLTATKTIVANTSELKTEIASLTVNTKYTENNTINISTSGTYSFVANFESLEKSAENKTKTILSQWSKTYDKNSAENEYISGDEITVDGENGDCYTITITPYYKETSVEPENVGSALEVTTKYKVTLGLNTVKFTYSVSDNQFIINGEESSDGIYTVSDNKYKYKFVYDNGTFKIYEGKTTTDTDVNETTEFVDDTNANITTIYVVTIDGNPQEFTYDSENEKFTINNKPIDNGGHYETTNYTYKFTYANDNVTVQQVKFNYTYNFDPSKTKTDGISVSNVNIVSQSQDLKSSKTTLNSNNYSMQYGTIKAEYSLSKDDITLSVENNNNLNIKIKPKATYAEPTKNIESIEGNVAGQDYFECYTFHKNSNEDNIFLLIKPTEIINLTKISETTAKVEFKYEVTGVIAYSDNYNTLKTEYTNNSNGLTVFRELKFENITVGKTEVKEKEYTPISDSNIESSYTFVKNYKVTSYWANYEKDDITLIIPKTPMGTDAVTVSVQGKDDGSRYITDGKYVQIATNTGLAYENYNISKTNTSTITSKGYSASGTKVESYSATGSKDNNLSLEIVSDDGETKTYLVDATIGENESDSSLKLTEESNAETATITAVKPTSQTMSFTIEIDGKKYSGYYYIYDVYADVPITSYSATDVETATPSLKIEDDDAKNVTYDADSQTMEFEITIDGTKYSGYYDDSTKTTTLYKVTGQNHSIYISTETTNDSDDVINVEPTTIDLNENYDLISIEGVKYKVGIDSETKDVYFVSDSDEKSHELIETKEENTYYIKTIYYLSYKSDSTATLHTIKTEKSGRVYKYEDKTLTMQGYTQYKNVNNNLYVISTFKDGTTYDVVETDKDNSFTTDDNVKFTWDSDNGYWKKGTEKYTENSYKIESSGTIYVLEDYGNVYKQISYTINNASNFAYAIQLKNIKTGDAKECEYTNEALSGKIETFKTAVNYNSSSFEISGGDVTEKGSNEWAVDGDYYIDDTGAQATIYVYPNKKAVNFTLKYYLNDFTASDRKASTTTTNTEAKNYAGTILTADVDLKNVSDGITGCKNLSGNGYNITYRIKANGNVSSLFNVVTGFVKDVNIGGTNIVTDLTRNYDASFVAQTGTKVTLYNLKTYGAIVQSAASNEISCCGVLKQVKEVKLDNITTFVNFASYYDEYYYTTSSRNGTTSKTIYSTTFSQLLGSFVENFVNTKKITNYGTIIGYDGRNAYNYHSASKGQSICAIINETAAKNIEITNNGIIKAGDGGDGYANYIGNFTHSTKDTENEKIEKPSDLEKIAKYSKGTEEVKNTNFNSSMEGSAGQDAKQGITGAYGVNVGRINIDNLDGTKDNNIKIYSNDGEYKMIKFQKTYIYWGRRWYDGVLSYKSLGTNGYDVYSSFYYQGNSTQGDMDYWKKIITTSEIDKFYMNCTLYGFVDFKYIWYKFNDDVISKKSKYNGYIYASEDIIGCGETQYKTYSSNKKQSTLEKSTSIKGKNYDYYYERLEVTNGTKSSYTIEDSTPSVEFKNTYGEQTWTGTDVSYDATYKKFTFKINIDNKAYNGTYDENNGLIMYSNDGGFAWFFFWINKTVTSPALKINSCYARNVSYDAETQIYYFEWQDYEGTYCNETLTLYKCKGLSNSNDLSKTQK